MPIKLTRAQIKAMRAKWLKEQGGVCPLCQKPIDLSIPREGVIDHAHDTGLIRGVLHRSCNSGLGKMEHAVGHWGSKSMKYSDIIPWIESALEYYKREPKPFIYPEHLTEDEKKVKANAKRRQQRAATKAKKIVRTMKKDSE